MAAYQYVYVMKGLNKTFPGGKQVLKDIWLSFLPGAKIGVLGPNGAGKTTLLMAISGVVRPTAGELKMEGRSLVGLKPGDIIRRGVAHVPEGRRIFPELTVAENLRLGALMSGNRARSRESIERTLDLFPILRTRYNAPGGVLSGGEQQMLAIARGLASSPRLLLIDEPSLGLSPVAVEQVYGLLREVLRAGMTLLLVEQSVEIALEMSSKVFVMESGRMVSNGPAAEFQKNSKLTDIYLGESL
jgi:branched-chain amino acid transport system ATP-binding protein